MTKLSAPEIRMPAPNGGSRILTNPATIIALCLYGLNIQKERKRNAMAKKPHLTTVVGKINTFTGTHEECDEKMTLKQMQDYVGGYIEMCPCTLDGCTLVVNENGAYTNLPHNPLATDLVRPGTLIMPDGLRGNALVVRSKSL